MVFIVGLIRLTLTLAKNIPGCIPDDISRDQDGSDLISDLSWAQNGSSLLGGVGVVGGGNKPENVDQRVSLRRVCRDCDLHCFFCRLPARREVTIRSLP